MVKGTREKQTFQPRHQHKRLTNPPTRPRPELEGKGRGETCRVSSSAQQTPQEGNSSTGRGPELEAKAEEEEHPGCPQSSASSPRGKQLWGAGHKRERKEESQSILEKDPNGT